jgi:hypothetical protein
MYALISSNTNVRSNTSGTEVLSNTKYYRPGNTDVPSNTSSTDDCALIQSTIGLVILMYALIPSTRSGNTEAPSNTSSADVRSNNEYYRPSNTDVPSNASSTDDYALMPSTIGPVILTYDPTLVALMYALIPSTRPGNTEVRSNAGSTDVRSNTKY